eukprot:jgi/Mesvir1/10212/Mv08532-RA.1
MQCKGKTRKGSKCRKQCRTGRVFCGLHGAAGKKRRHAVRQGGEEKTGHDLYTDAVASSTIPMSTSPRARDLLGDRSRKLTSEVPDWKKMVDSYIPDEPQSATYAHDAYVDRPYRGKSKSYRNISPRARDVMLGVDEFQDPQKQSMESLLRMMERERQELRNAALPSHPQAVAKRVHEKQMANMGLRKRDAVPDLSTWLKETQKRHDEAASHLEELRWGNSLVADAVAKTRPKSKK